MALEHAKQYTNELNQVLEHAIPNLEFTNIHPTPLKVNTMTVVCKTTLSNYNTSISDLKQYIEENPIERDMVVSKKNLGKTTIIVKWVQKFSDATSRNIAAKLFGNGTIHITGVTNPHEAVIISDFFTRYIQDTLHTLAKRHSANGATTNNSDINIDTSNTTTNYTICMIQSNFDVRRQISLPDARTRWNCQDTQVIYNIDKHRTLHIKFSDVRTSAIIFPSGKVLITGARQPSHLLHVYNQVVSFIDAEYDHITSPIVTVVKVPKKRGRKRKAEHDAFYSDDILLTLK